MVSYKVIVLPSAKKDLRNILHKDVKRITQRIEALAENPRPHGCERLIGQNKYRIRQGDYRILYTIIDKELVVWVVKIGHRREIYRVSEEKEKFEADEAPQK